MLKHITFALLLLGQSISAKATDHQIRIAEPACIGINGGIEIRAMIDSWDVRSAKLKYRIVKVSPWSYAPHTEQKIPRGESIQSGKVKIDGLYIMNEGVRGYPNGPYSFDHAQSFRISLDQKDIDYVTEYRAWLTWQVEDQKPESFELNCAKPSKP